jgi:hypothetical protein
VAVVCRAGRSPSSGTSQQTAAIAQSTIKIDYPLDGSIFPPEITPPTFLWHDPSPAKRWVIQISLAIASRPMQLEAAGEPMRQGKMDPTPAPASHSPPSRHLPTPGSPTRKPGKRSSGSPPSQPRTSQSWDLPTIAPKRRCRLAK